MKSFGSILEANKGLGPGFDSLRVLLSFCVIAWHCVPLTSGTALTVKATPFWPLVYSILPMFFALSGFLVTGSALRLPLSKFATSRVLRIVPALIVDTLVTILIIGPIFTTVSLSAYFGSSVTHAYLLNMVGEIHFLLPGLFENNPYPRTVNGSLWTLPAELACYVFMGTLIASGWVKNWRAVAAVYVLDLCLMAIARQLYGHYHIPGLGYFVAPGAKLVPMFLIGSLFFLLKDKIVYSWRLFALCVVLGLAPGLFLSSTWWESAIWIAATAPLWAYIVTFLGLTKIPAIPLFNRGDYSYGIYLYGFPIQQVIVLLSGTKSPVMLFALTFIPVTLLAIFSWHVVEKPTLRLRKAFSFAAKREEMRKAELASDSDTQQNSPIG